MLIISSTKSAAKVQKKSELRKNNYINSRKSRQNFSSYNYFLLIWKQKTAADSPEQAV